MSESGELDARVDGMIDRLGLSLKLRQEHGGRLLAFVDAIESHFGERTTELAVRNSHIQTLTVTNDQLSSLIERLVGMIERCMSADGVAEATRTARAIVASLDDGVPFDLSDTVDSEAPLTMASAFARAGDKPFRDISDADLAVEFDDEDDASRAAWTDSVRQGVVANARAMLEPDEETPFHLEDSLPIVPSFAARIGQSLAVALDTGSDDAREENVQISAGAEAGPRDSLLEPTSEEQLESAAASLPAGRRGGAGYSDDPDDPFVRFVDEGAIAAEESGRAITDSAGEPDPVDDEIPVEFVDRAAAPATDETDSDEFDLQDIDIPEMASEPDPQPVDVRPDPARRDANIKELMARLEAASERARWQTDAEAERGNAPRKRKQKRRDPGKAA